MPHVSRERGHVTTLLQRWAQGDREALDGVMPLVYGELRRLAQSYLQGERPNHTLQATALVNEAYLRIVDAKHRHFENRSEFFAVAARAMRHILVDHARQKRAAKRGGGVTYISFDEAKGPAPSNAVDIMALDEVLEDLIQQDERQAKVVELRYFCGLTIDETANVLKISPATVSREWNMARAWLRRALRHRTQCGAK